MDNIIGLACRWFGHELDGPAYSYHELLPIQNGGISYWWNRCNQCGVAVPQVEEEDNKYYSFNRSGLMVEFDVSPLLYNGEITEARMQSWDTTI